MFSNKLVCDIICFIDKDINRKVSISDIEDEFFYNRYYIMKLFKREIGVSITNYVKFVLILSLACVCINIFYIFASRKLEENRINRP